jgi:hypothetical protein
MHSIIQSYTIFFQHLMHGYDADDEFKNNNDELIKSVKTS